VTWAEPTDEERRAQTPNPALRDGRRPVDPLPLERTAFWLPQLVAATTVRAARGVARACLPRSAFAGACGETPAARTTRRCASMTITITLQERIVRASRVGRAATGP
jgi:hypothetical protein